MKSISKSFSITDPNRRSMIGWSQYTKGHNYVTTVGRSKVVVLHIIRWCFIFVPNFVKISQKISKSYWADAICIPKFTKRQNCVKTVGWVMVLVLSCHLMMIYIWAKFYESTLKGFRVTDMDSRVDTRVVAMLAPGRNSERTNGRKTESLYRAMPEARQKSFLFCLT